MAKKGAPVEGRLGRVCERRGGCQFWSAELVVGDAKLRKNCRTTVASSAVARVQDSLAGSTNGGSLRSKESCCFCSTFPSHCSPTLQANNQRAILYARTQALTQARTHAKTLSLFLAQGAQWVGCHARKNKPKEADCAVCLCSKIAKLEFLRLGCSHLQQKRDRSAALREIVILYCVLYTAVHWTPYQVRNRMPIRPQFR